MRKKSGLQFYRRRKKINPVIFKEAAIWVLCILVIVFIAFAAIYCFGIKTSVIGDSMEPSLYNGQEIYINRMIYNFVSPKRNDVIVFKPALNQNSHFYVKRVIGLPGETIQIKNGRIYIDGELYIEDNEIYDLIEDSGIAENEIVLAKNEFFVLGDNRNNSEDSRSANIGVVKQSDIFGQAWFHMSCEEEEMGLIK